MRSWKVCALFTGITKASLDRLIFRRTLNGIVSELRPLSERRGLVQFLNNADYANTLNGFVQDLANAITDYQVCGANPMTRTV